MLKCQITESRCPFLQVVPGRRAKWKGAGRVAQPHFLLGFNPSQIFPGTEVSFCLQCCEPPHCRGLFGPVLSWYLGRKHKEQDRPGCVPCGRQGWSLPQWGPLSDPGLLVWAQSEVGQLTRLSYRALGNNAGGTDQGQSVLGDLPRRDLAHNAGAFP